MTIETHKKFLNLVPIKLTVHVILIKSQLQHVLLALETRGEVQQIEQSLLGQRDEHLALINRLHHVISPEQIRLDVAIVKGAHLITECCRLKRRHTGCAGDKLGNHPIISECRV